MPATPVDNDLDFQGFSIQNVTQKSVTCSVLTVTGATTLDENYHTVFLNAATATTTAVFTLPDPTSCTGRIYNIGSTVGRITLSRTVLDQGRPFTAIGHTRLCTIQSDGTDWRSTAPFLPDLITTRPNPIWDLLTVPTTTSGPIALSSAGTGAAVTAVAPTQPNSFGVVASSSGTTATGRVQIGSINGFPIVAGSGSLVFSAAIDIKQLSTATERFQLLVGFYDTFTAVNQVDGVYLLYDEGGVSAGSTASPNWKLVTASNSARTFVNSSTVAATGWINLRIEINAAGTSAQFFINGSSLGTITTNIPTGVARTMGYGIYLQKSVGITPVLVHADWLFPEVDRSENPRGAY